MRILGPLSLLVLMLLFGCNQAAKPGEPALQLEYRSVKTLNFSWSDVTGETSYQLKMSSSDSFDIGTVANIPANVSQYRLSPFLPAQLHKLYFLAACNTAGCSESNTIAISPAKLATAVGYFKASNTDAGDTFGWQVAVSADGSTLAVAAYLESGGATAINGDQSDNSKSASGAVYVFARQEDGSWKQEAYIKASNSDVGDQFGLSLDLSDDGSVLAVGAPREDGDGASSNDNSKSDSGAAYVFVHDPSGWKQQAYLKASNADTGDRFGSSVALSADGKGLAVGAAGEDGNGASESDNSKTDSGAVYVFAIDSNGAWSQQAYLKAPNADANDAFGYTVDLSATGTTLAVSAINESSSATGINGDANNNNASESGAVYLFGWNGSTWQLQAYVKASNTNASDYFGYSLALTDDRLLVGAPWEDSMARGFDGDQFSNAATDSGAAYLFIKKGSGQWQQIEYIKASESGSNDQFGSSVAISADGRLMAISARYEASSATGFNGEQGDNQANFSGAVYTFYQDDDGNWTQQAYIKSPNSEAFDIFGNDLALSSDGSTLIVGASGEDSNATGIGGDQNNNSASGSGAAYVF